MPHHQLPWTLISNEVIDVIFNHNASRGSNNHSLLQACSWTGTKTHTTINMLALTSATGKLGGAVLNAILDNKLIDPKELVVCVRLSFYSSSPIPAPNSRN